MLKTKPFWPPTVVGDPALFRLLAYAFWTSSMLIPSALVTVTSTFESLRAPTKLAPVPLGTAEKLSGYPIVNFAAECVFRVALGGSVTTESRTGAGAGVLPPEVSGGAATTCIWPGTNDARTESKIVL